MSVFRFYAIWLPVLVVCFFDLCGSQSSSNSGDSAFSNSRPIHHRHKRSAGNSLTEPGIIVGIIVGVVGVLVVIGVVILLCRLFCCSHVVCCPCCEGEETYLEAGTVPIKIPSQEGTPDNNRPISTLSHNQRPAKNRQPETAGNAEDHAPSSLPQYDDVPQFDWKLNGLAKTKQRWESDAERRSEDSYSSTRQLDTNPPPLTDESERRVPNSLPLSGTKRNEKTPTRRKLTYPDDPDLSQHGEDFSPLEHERSKKRNTEGVRHRREFPFRRDKKHRERDFKPTQEEDVPTVTDDRPNAGEVNDDKEFPLLEFEPRKRNFNPSYAEECPTTRKWEKSRDTGREDFKPVHYDYSPQPKPAHYDHQPQPKPVYHDYHPQPKPVHFDPQPQPTQPSNYPDHRSRVWGEERRFREHTDAMTTSAPPANPVGSSSRNYSDIMHYTVGHVNPAFNQDSSETTV